MIHEHNSPVCRKKKKKGKAIIVVGWLADWLAVEFMNADEQKTDRNGEGERRGEWNRIRRDDLVYMRGEKKNSRKNRDTVLHSCVVPENTCMYQRRKNTISEISRSSPLELTLSLSLSFSLGLCCYREHRVWLRFKHANWMKRTGGCLCLWTEGEPER